MTFMRHAALYVHTFRVFHHFHVGLLCDHLTLILLLHGLRHPKNLYVSFISRVLQSL